MNQEIIHQLTELKALCQRMADTIIPEIAHVAEVLIASLKGGNKLLIMGNGGSAADAQHFAGEIISRFRMERPGLPAIALSTDTSVITAIGNDYGFDRIFSRQVEALAAPGDVIIGISTSGNSLNVLKALEAGRSAGCITIGLLGKDGGSISAHCDFPLVVPSSDTPRIQEAHITIIHILCDLIEQHLFGHPNSPTGQHV